MDIVPTYLPSPGQKWTRLRVLITGPRGEKIHKNLTPMSSQPTTLSPAFIRQKRGRAHYRDKFTAEGPNHPGDVTLIPEGTLTLSGFRE